MSQKLNLVLRHLCFSESSIMVSIMKYFQNIFSSNKYFQKYVHLNWRNWFEVSYSRGRSIRNANRFHDYSATILRCYKDVDIFFPCTTKLWNSLPIECFPLTYDLNGFKSRIDKHLLPVSSF